jgi:malate/lactate dehydrogenase
MKVAVIGCGNVGANLLQFIADIPLIDQIFLVDIAEDIMKAAIMDVAGFKPRGARKITASTSACLSNADVIINSAGAKAAPGETSRDVLNKNLSIVTQNLEGIPLKSSAIIIHLPSPVEALTAYIQRRTRLPKSQVMGFGGDLDLNRLIYVLEERGVPSEGVAIIGEHGVRGIPVYETETDYDAVASKVNHFLGEIGKLAGQKRNLATAPLLAGMIRSIVEDHQDVHYLSGYHPDYDMVLLWPFRLGKQGAPRPEPLKLPPRAQKELEILCEKRRAEKTGELKHLFG